MAVENWLADALRMGRLVITEYATVIEKAALVAKHAAQYPDEWRVLLKTWIKEAQWHEEIESGADEDDLLIPPPCDEPRFTPDDWNKPKETERHGRLDDRSSA